MSKPIPNAPGFRRYHLVGLASLLMIAFGVTMVVMRSEGAWATDAIDPQRNSPTFNDGRTGTTSHVMAAATASPLETRPEHEAHPLDILLNSPLRLCPELLRRLNPETSEAQEHLLSTCHADVLAFRECKRTEDTATCVQRLQDSQTGLTIRTRFMDQRATNRFEDP